MKEVFISYKTEDYQKADTIRSLLKRNGIDCWMGDKDIHASNTYTEVITKAIKNCSVFVLVLSRMAQESTYILSEFECAISYKKRIVPVVIENFEIKDKFEFHLRSRQKISAFEDWKGVQGEILDTVQHLLGEPEPKKPQINENHSLVMEAVDSIRHDENIIDVRYGKNRIPVKVSKDHKYQLLCYHCEEAAITNKDPERANEIINIIENVLLLIAKIFLFAFLVSIYLFSKIVDLNTVSRLSLLTLHNPFFWLFLISALIISTRYIYTKIKEIFIKVTEAEYNTETCTQKLYCKKCKQAFEVKIPIDERKKFFFVDSETGKRHNL